MKSKVMLAATVVALSALSVVGEVSALDGDDAQHLYHANSGQISYMNVSLNGCNGGGLNVSNWWENKISATSSPVCWAQHYDHDNYANKLTAKKGLGAQWLGDSAYRTNSLRYTSTKNG